MVKFGRHVDFFVGDPTRRRLYVVPYKDVQRRTCNDLLHPPYSSPPPPLPPPPPPDLTTTTTTTISSISPPRPSRSGLSELFDCEHDGGYGVDDDDDYNINGNDCAEEEEEEEEEGGGGSGGGGTTTSSSSATDAARMASPVGTMAKNAVTITAGTGAELAAALRQSLQLSASHRGRKRVVAGTTTRAAATTTATTTMKTMATVTTVTTRVGFDLDGEIEDGDDDDDNAVGILPAEIVADDEEDGEFANFFLSQRFQNEWRRCHRRASDDFDSAMKTFWGEVSRRDRLYIRPLVRGGSIISFRFFLFFGPNPYIYYNREGI